MIQAIVYTSCTGHTKEFAEILGNETGLPVYELSDAAKALSKNAEILFLGWLMAGKVKGYPSASKQFHVRAVCGVGMAPGEGQREDIYKTNKVPKDIPVFCLQGGFEMGKLHGIYKFMMRTMQATVGKKLSEKTDRTPQEEEMLELLTKGGNRVSKDKLDGVMEWYKKQSER